MRGGGKWLCGWGGGWSDVKDGYPLINHIVAHVVIICQHGYDGWSHVVSNCSHRCIK